MGCLGICKGVIQLDIYTSFASFILICVFIILNIEKSPF